LARAAFPVRFTEFAANTQLPTKVVNSGAVFSIANDAIFDVAFFPTHQSFENLFSDVELAPVSVTSARHVRRLLRLGNITRDYL
jgi:hypothetical protein